MIQQQITKAKPVGYNKLTKLHVLRTKMNLAIWQTETTFEMKCIILDDKPFAQNTLSDFIDHVPYLTLVAKCSTAFEAFEVLQNQKIDLIFLEVILPNVSGIDFIKSLESKPMIIFTTAYSEYAIEGFNLNATDYLIKPITFDRFLKSVNKAYEFFTFKNYKYNSGRNEKEASNSKEFILVKADYKTIKININDILYVEGLKDYIKIYTTQSAKPVITLNSLKNMQKNLPSEKFSRIHKSYIIALDYIKTINKAQVVIGDTYIPIGESYKNFFLNEMNNRRL